MAKVFNKVIYDGATLMDISHDTVTEDTMLAGTTAHGADGTLVTGTLGRILKFQNVTVPTSAWASDSTYDEYPYRASIALTGVTAAMCPQVYFSMALIDEPEVTYAPLSETYAGGVYIYADVMPSAAITIPSIVCL